MSPDPPYLLSPGPTSVELRLRSHQALSTTPPPALLVGGRTRGRRDSFW